MSRLSNALTRLVHAFARLLHGEALLRKLDEYPQKLAAARIRSEVYRERWAVMRQVTLLQADRIRELEARLEELEQDDWK